jgi:hypothetical protein
MIIFYEKLCGKSTAVFTLPKGQKCDKIGKKVEYKKSIGKKYGRIGIKVEKMLQ